MPNGVTPSEKYLGELCKSSFLSLWSFPNPYNDRGITETQREGKELCDLLVVFENHVIIFSDKSCNFKDSGDLGVDWARWYKRAIDSSANQVYGAERWISEHPDRIFKDKVCNEPFPLSFPDKSNIVFHRIVVALGASQRIEEYIGGNSRGSLMLASNLIADEHLDPPKPYGPFQLGHINPNKGFVHIFDDVTLDIVMRELDTISDFVNYLGFKNNLFLSDKTIFIAGEEELLGFYLNNYQGNKDMSSLLEEIDGYSDFIIPEGIWDDYLNSSSFKYQNDLKNAGSFIDNLIEYFTKHTLEKTLAYGNDEELKYHEKNLRFLAAEPRQSRAIISEAMSKKFHTTPANVRTAIVIPSFRKELKYVFVLMPRLVNQTQKKYRLERQALLKLYACVVKHQNPNVNHVVCIGTESGGQKKARSEDLMSFDFSNWTLEEDKYAKKIQEEHEILNNVQENNIYSPPNTERVLSGGTGNRTQRRYQKSLKRKKKK